MTPPQSTFFFFFFPPFFAEQLNRYANEIKFSVAADFKLKLDAAFRKGKPLDLFFFFFFSSFFCPLGGGGAKPQLETLHHVHYVRHVERDQAAEWELSPTLCWPSWLQIGR